MTTQVPVRSVLKQPSAPSAQPSEAEAKAEKDRRNLDLALQHAYLIQHQRDVEARILIAIELLLDIPSTGTPTAEEARKFTILVQPFQPSDFDALIEERHTTNRCGYALCANPPRSVSMGANAMWRLGQAGGDFCSNVCVKKALYVKTQLSEVPAWEREADLQTKVVLLGSDESLQTVVPTRQTTERQQQQNVSAHPADDLAAERGEHATSVRPKQVMAERIVEKRNVSYKPLSGVATAAVSHTAIEGYEPKRAANDRFGGDSDDENDDNMAAALFDDIDERGVGAQYVREDGTVKSYWNGKEDSDSDG